MALTSCDSQPEQPVVLTDQSVAHSNQTGLNLLRELSQKGDRNIALSPVSINGVLGALQRGTDGNTLTEMNNALGDLSAFPQFCSQYSKEDNGTIISNMLVVDKNLKLTDGYKKGTPPDELKQADFKADPEKERKEINSWVEKNTKGEIKDFLKPNTIDTMTRLVALNATVFEGKWNVPFEERNTREDVFHTAGGDVQAMMMGRTGDYVFSKDKENCTMVSLPYTSGEAGKPGPVSFVIVMPDEGTTLHDFIAGMTWEKMENLLPTVEQKPREIGLQLPKFEIKTPTFQLSDQLKKMGIHDLFDENKADLTKMTMEKGLYLSEVYHQCYIKVDEKGTKAAAATAGIIAKMSLPLQITINRPFMWMIYDSDRKMILFCGTVDNPVATQES